MSFFDSGLQEALGMYACETYVQLKPLEFIVGQCNSTRRRCKSAAGKFKDMCLWHLVATLLEQKICKLCRDKKLTFMLTYSILKTA